MADESNTTRILEGVRVLEVASFIFAPAAATMMSDFGADIIKVEPPGLGDTYRHLYRLPPMPVCEENYCWILEGRNKKSIAVDLKQQAGRQIVLDLLKAADVFLTNYQPSVLCALGLTEEELRPLNPRMIYAHATGYGECGGDVEMPGFDMTAYWARSGLMDAVSARNCEPALSVAGLGDHPGSSAMFGAIMMALFRRERTGQGSKVSTSLAANGAWANSCMLQAQICGATFFEKNSRVAPFNVLVNHYVASDERRFLLCCLKPLQDWPQLCKAVGLDHLCDDPRFASVVLRQQNGRELVPLLDERFATKTLAEWKVIFDRHCLVWSPVPKVSEVVNDPQLVANDIIVTFDHPDFQHLRTVNSPIFVQGETKKRPQPPPALGEHTREILHGLDYDQARIDQLIAQRVVQA